MTRGRYRTLGVLGILPLLALALQGCQEPTEVVPVGPPGSSIPRIPPPEKEGAQALGEPNIRAPVDATRRKAVPGTMSPPTAIGEVKTTPSGVKYETLKAGDGPEVTPGQTVIVHYTGTLADGKVFDTSHEKDKDEPRSLEIAPEKIIAGWEEGVPGMRVGERRRLTIPPAMAYGDLGSPPTVPGNATLTFEIELIGIK
jgi:FKBP-type peptidyl-prolyl cis-trans isomerase FkpA